MSNIFIENYRGIDIGFSTDYEKFTCVITDRDTKESSSYSAVKKFIDDYKKDNQNFKPFMVENLPGEYGNDIFKIIGIRKDGRFIAENRKGEKEQVSTYDEDKYMIDKPENKKHLTQYNELMKEIENQEIINNKKRKEIISKLNIVTLKDYKKTILNQ